MKNGTAYGEYFKDSARKLPKYFTRPRKMFFCDTHHAFKPYPLAKRIRLWASVNPSFAFPQRKPFVYSFPYVIRVRTAPVRHAHASYVYPRWIEGNRGQYIQNSTLFSDHLVCFSFGKSNRV
jgi:hypothetical protein